MCNINQLLANLWCSVRQCLFNIPVFHPPRNGEYKMEVIISCCGSLNIKQTCSVKIVRFHWGIKCIESKNLGTHIPFNNGIVRTICSELRCDIYVWPYSSEYGIWFVTENICRPNRPGLRRERMAQDAVNTPYYLRIVNMKITLFEYWDQDKMAPIFHK